MIIIWIRKTIQISLSSTSKPDLIFGPTWTQFLGWVEHTLRVQNKVLLVHCVKQQTPEKTWCLIILFFQIVLLICSRPLMGSTDQADPSCIYFRISWILMERLWFYFFGPLNLLQGLGSLKNWLLQKLSMNILDQKF